LLPLSIVMDRNRAAAYSAVLIAGAGMFGIFLFVTYYVQTTLGFSPMQTGLAFLPMIAALVLAAQLGTNIFVPRFGPKIMVPIGMSIMAFAMVLLTRLGVDSNYAPEILIPLIVLGLGMGSTMPAAMQTATLGVDRQYAGVASAMVNTSQQVGGSIGVALLNTLAATAATDYLAAHSPATAAIAAEAAVHSYATAYWWSAAFFAFGAALTALLFRRRSQGLNLSHTPVDGAEPVLAH
jgi:MFS family permease